MDCSFDGIASKSSLCLGVAVKTGRNTIQGDQDIRARFSNIKAGIKYYEIWWVFSKFSLGFKNLYSIKKNPL
jgi:hypothetical protein